MTRYLLIIILILCSVKSNGQKNKNNSIGLRQGFIKKSYYDETLNFKIYNKTSFNPYHLRFTRLADKNSYVINFYFINTTLIPKNKEDHVMNDEISLQMGAIEFTYLRKVFNLKEKLEFKSGAKFSSNGYGGDRLFRKAYPAAGNKTQSTYEITFISIYVNCEISYSISELTGINLSIALPLLAVNSRNYNTKISPLNQELWLASLDKYSGFSSDLALVKKFNRLSLEIFQSFHFLKYKTPNKKKLLTNKIGLGLYYDF